MKQTVRIAGGINELFGTLDENLKFLESTLHVTTHLKDHDMEIEGDAAQVERAARLLGAYNDRVLAGHIPTSQEVKSLLQTAAGQPVATLHGAFSPSHKRAFGKKSVMPKSANQKRYIEALETYDMVFAIGPGGTGKTYLAVALAVSALLSKQVNRIILARPAVEAGERLGFLPGTLQEKVDPYMRPLYDALHDLLEADKLESYLEKGHHRSRAAGLHARPHAQRFVRDPRRGAEHHQRADENVPHAPGIQFQSRDHRRRHADRPARSRANPVWSKRSRWSGSIEGISLVYFDERDVVRHSLVQRIIKAYEERTGSQPNGTNASRPARAAAAIPSNEKQ